VVANNSRRGGVGLSHCFFALLLCVPCSGCSGGGVPDGAANDLIAERVGRVAIELFPESQRVLSREMAVARDDQLALGVVSVQRCGRGQLGARRCDSSPHLLVLLQHVDHSTGALLPVETLGQRRLRRHVVDLFARDDRPQSLHQQQILVLHRRRAIEGQLHRLAPPRRLELLRRRG
jgi:hypothetical protein